MYAYMYVGMYVCMYVDTLSRLSSLRRMSDWYIDNCVNRRQSKFCIITYIIFSCFIIEKEKKNITFYFQYSITILEHCYSYANCLLCILVLKY